MPYPIPTTSHLLQGTIPRGTLLVSLRGGASGGSLLFRPGALRGALFLPRERQDHQLLFLRLQVEEGDIQCVALWVCG